MGDELHEHFPFELFHDSCSLLIKNFIITFRSLNFSGCISSLVLLNELLKLCFIRLFLFTIFLRFLSVDYIARKWGGWLHLFDKISNLLWCLNQDLNMVTAITLWLRESLLVTWYIHGPENMFSIDCRAVWNKFLNNLLQGHSFLSLFRLFPSFLTFLLFSTFALFFGVFRCRICGNLGFSCFFGLLLRSFMSFS